MPLLEDRTASFIVRLWCERGQSGAKPVWRGSVEHAQTGDRRFFQKYDDLITFLRSVSPAFDPGPRRDVEDADGREGASTCATPSTRSPP